MDRRRAIVAFAVAALPLTAPAQLFAQQKAKRIGLLWIKGEGASSAHLKAFREQLRAQGYAEGREIEIDDRSLVDRYPLLPDAAVRLVDDKVNVILCYGSTATSAARKATSVTPIVMIAGTDPVSAGYADSLARPGKNITGIALINQELGAKRLELLKQITPGLRTVGVPLNPESAREAIGLKNMETPAQRLSLELHAVPVRIPKELDAAMQSAAKLGVGGFVPIASTMFSANTRTLVSAIERTGLPAVYGSDEFAREGGLLSYGPNVTEAFRHAALLVDKILKGAKAAELPFEQPTKFDLVINMKTAKALGLTIPKELLLRADEVIE